MTFTKKPLKWNAVGVEPSEEKKIQGFGNGEYPAAGHFDFKFNSDYEAIKELQEKAGEVKTINGQLPDEKGNIKVNVDTSNLATKEELKAKYSKPLDGIPQSDFASDVQTSLSKADGSAKQTDLEALDKKVNEHSAEDATNAKKGHVQLTDDINGNSNSLVPTQNAVRKGIEQSSYKTVKSGKDANGIFTSIMIYRKSNGTLVEKSVLSGGTSPNYTTRTVTYYGLDGTTAERTDTFTLAYDSDGVCTSEV
ncbi:tail fiber protein [Rummeliibacillus sp. TYF-LIM-RU47]|uniref:tail fiber protein n=1 Tax=Rummeliibacillus sp. TYF-LIM-RU47 TaxID=2608406 RepID=UPI001238FF2F|nr:tail fiber protein [Rummeliibacillus sp. TYF-LIM-RU47]